MIASGITTKAVYFFWVRSRILRPPSISSVILASMRPQAPFWVALSSMIHLVE